VAWDPSSLGETKPKANLELPPMALRTPHKVNQMRPKRDPLGERGGEPQLARLGSFQLDLVLRWAHSPPSSTKWNTSPILSSSSIHPPLPLFLSRYHQWCQTGNTTPRLVLPAMEDAPGVSELLEKPPRRHQCQYCGKYFSRGEHRIRHERSREFPGV
jgi:hypothetical protein